MRCAMPKNNDITAAEMKAMLPWFLVVNGVYFAVLTVLFFLLNFNYTLFVGGIYGNIVTVLNFLLLGKTAEKALRRKSPKSAQSYMNTMYCLRYLGMFVLLSAAALLPFVNILAAIVPLLFPKIIITIRGLREKTE